MNIFAKIFGKKKEIDKPVSTVSIMDTIHKLREQVDILNKRNKYIELKISILMDDIKQIAKSNKQKALLLLDKKKTYTDEINKNDSASILLEKQIAVLETSIINKQVVDSLRNGNIFVKKVQKNTNVDDIEDLMDDIKESTDIQKTISDAFSNQIHDITNDEDLLNEFNEITSEETTSEENKKECIQEKIPSYNFPNVPKDNISKNKKQEDDDEEELLRLTTALLC